MRFAERKAEMDEQLDRREVARSLVYRWLALGRRATAHRIPWLPFQLVLDRGGAVGLQT